MPYRLASRAIQSAPASRTERRHTRSRALPRRRCLATSHRRATSPPTTTPLSPGRRTRRRPTTTASMCPGELWLASRALHGESASRARDWGAALRGAPEGLVGAWGVPRCSACHGERNRARRPGTCRADSTSPATSTPRGLVQISGCTAWTATHVQYTLSYGSGSEWETKGNRLGRDDPRVEWRN